MPRLIILSFLLATLLAACTPVSPDTACSPASAAPSLKPMRWGYYPGYGCGPVPPAITLYP